MIKTQNSKEGLVLTENKRYGNVIQVVHSFKGNLSVEDAIFNIVLSKVKDKHYLNNCLNRYGKI